LLIVSTQFLPWVINFKNAMMKNYLSQLAPVLLFYSVCTLFLHPASMAQSSADAGWPRQVTKDGATLVYYQPQVTGWKDYKVLSGDLAFALTPKGGQEVHGAASIQCGTLVDKEAHTAYLRDITATSIRFPSLDDAAAEKASALFRELFPTGGETISVDRLIADLDQQKQPAHTVELKNDPPVIFYSAGPAILLTILGEPVLTPVAKTDLQFIVNTNWDLFYEKSKKKYYLLAEQQWMTAAELKGPWTATKTLPKDMTKLPAGENFDEVKKMVPPPSVASAAPQVFYSTEPAELIVFKGAPVYTKIDGTQLLYVSNTDNNIFLDNGSKEFYVLLSGRWFSSKELNGPWAYAGNNLPADFARIPEKSPKAQVLASVPGTVQASDAVLLAQIPATAIVNKKEAEAKVKVNYDGDPQFKPIDGTSMQYASNTQDKVIRVGDLYYLCFQAVWFVSASPTGPWKTADNVPHDIYTIPPSSPVYNVTYVTQTNATETTVESSSTAGYFGAFIIGMTVGAVIAYGTGWYYPPYMFWGAGMLYPIYRPWPCTYGAGYVYNPWTGGFAGGRRVYGPYGAAGSSAWYNPATGRYGRSASVQGWYGGRTVAGSYNPWTGGYAATSQGHNAYAQWGSSVAARGNQWVQTGHVTTANGTALGYRTSTGQQGVIARGANGTVIKGDNGVYAGHDGNVYKRNGQGNWSEYNKGGGWQQVKPANLSGATQKEGVLGGLNNSAQARQRGQVQTQRFRSMQRSGGFRRR
jgi:hypothetical protein